MFHGCFPLLQQGVLYSVYTLYDVQYTLLVFLRKHFYFMHPLKKYLSDREIKITAFSRLCGVSRDYIYKIMKGKKARHSIALKIHNLTGKEVLLEEISLKIKKNKR